MCELELAVRSKDSQLAEFQSSVTEKETMRPTGLGEEVNEDVKETPHWGEQNQNGSNGSGIGRQQVLHLSDILDELLPLLLGFLSAYEVCQLAIRAVSRFF